MIRWTRNKLIYPIKWVILSIMGLMIVLFIFVLYLNNQIKNEDKHLPILAFIYNKLKSPEKIKFEINNSIYSMDVDSMKSVNFSTVYKLGSNRIKISIGNCKSIIDDTFIIQRRNPGAISIEIDKPSDDLGFIWKIDSLTIKDYYFYKSIVKDNSIKRVKCAIIGRYLE